MRGDVTSPRHGTGQIDGFKGLVTNVPDMRAVGAGYLRKAENVVFDDAGNCRPRDGSSQYWAATSQRAYLAEMEQSENSSWTNGAVETTVLKFGTQARKITAAGATAMARVVPSIDITVGSKYAAAVMSVNFWVRTENAADVTAATLEIASDAGYANKYTWGILSSINGLAANSWTLITKTFASGTVTAIPDLTDIIRARVTLTLTGGSNQYFDDIYVDYSNVSQSWCTGQYQFRKISTSSRYHLAMFGETLYADLNESKAPYKVRSQFARNTPAYFETFEDRCGIFNGTDSPVIFTGTSYRNIGYPVPTSNPDLVAVGAGGALNAGDYYYGFTFVYGEGAVVHGESSLRQYATKVTTVLNGSVTIGGVTPIPVGVVGAGVIKRRVYRSRVNAGANATKYFVAEIANNTTTTYTDVAADTTIILNAEGPTDNGIPPVAKLAKFFHKTLVYITNSQYAWARPGTNLNETPETVPALNYGNLANAGEAVALVEFNQRLYCFQKRAIGKMFWRGSQLEYEPVQRSGDSGQSVGAYDQNAVTVVADRYIMWKDAEGQDWKMLPNEEIFPESRDVANINNNFNNLPITSTMDHYTTDTQAQWDLGTVGANLSTAGVSGKLMYKDRINAPLGSVSTGASFSTVWAPAATGYPTITGSAIQGQLLFAPLSVYFGGIHEFRWFVQPTSAALQLTSLTLPLQQDGYSQCSFNLYVYKYKYETGLLSSANTLLVVTGAGGPFADDGSLTLTFNLGNIYVPAGEKVVFRLQLLTGAAKIPLTKDSYFNNAFPAYNSTFYTPDGGVSGDAAPIDGGFSIYYGLTARVGTVSTQTSAILDATTALQRWHWLTYTTSTLKCGNAIRVSLEVSSDSTNWYMLTTTYSLTAVPGSLYSAAPILNEQFYFVPVRDYRVGELYPAGTQWRYGRFKITIDPNRVCSPTAEAYAGVSTTESSTFPVLASPAMTVSTEASFVTYDKRLYLRDTYTSEVVDAVSLGSWGTFSADYAENQQLLTFQIITSATTDFSGSTWYTITPGAPPPNASLVVSARYYKYRVIFQDNPIQESSDGSVSYVDEVKLSWAQGSAALAPYMPPVVFYYKDYIYLSWPSRTSRIHDSSIAVDAFKKTYEDVPHRYSTFTSPHYVSYCVVNGQLIGGPASGGKLMQLRNSDIADDNSSAVVGPLGIVEIQPWTMGNYNIKTLYWIYVGMQLSIYKYGFFLSEPGTYPVLSGALATPYFTVSAAALTASLAALNGAVPFSTGLLSLLGTIQSAVIGYNSVLALSTSAQSLSNYSSFKPYITEYGVQLALQERAFVIRVSMSAVKDTNGNAFFPILTGLGAEYHVENTRGI